MTSVHGITLLSCEACVADAFKATFAVCAHTVLARVRQAVVHLLAVSSFEPLWAGTNVILFRLCAYSCVVARVWVTVVFFLAVLALVTLQTNALDGFINDTTPTTVMTRIIITQGRYCRYIVSFWSLFVLVLVELFSDWFTVSHATSTLVTFKQVTFTDGTMMQSSVTSYHLVHMVDRSVVSYHLLVVQKVSVWKVLYLMSVVRVHSVWSSVFSFYVVSSVVSTKSCSSGNCPTVLLWESD